MPRDGRSFDILNASLVVFAGSLRSDSLRDIPTAYRTRDFDTLSGFDRTRARERDKKIPREIYFTRREYSWTRYASAVIDVAEHVCKNDRAQLDFWEMGMVVVEMSPVISIIIMREKTSGGLQTSRITVPGSNPIQSGDEETFRDENWRKNASEDRSG